MATKNYKVSDILEFSKKSHRKAGDGLSSGKYQFFTSSQIQSKWFNEADYEKESIILGTGGLSSIHFSKYFSTSADTFVLTSVNPLISIKYVYYFLSGNIELLEKGFKGAGLKHLSKTHTEKILIPIPINKNGEPDLKEQSRIILLLEEAESLKNKRFEANNKINTLIPALFSNIIGETENLKKRPLASFCKITTGNTPPRVKKEYYGSDLEWIKTDNIIDNQINPAQADEYLSNLGVSIGRTVEKDSILMNCIAGSIRTIGNICLTNRKVSFNQQINAITVNDDTNPLFLYWYLKVHKKEVQNLASGVLKFIINKSRLEGFEVPIVSKDIQDKFVLLVKEIELQKDKQKESTQKVDELFNAVMAKSFV